jgi:hypothetical protein
LHQFPKYILSWNSTCSGQFVCASSGVYSLYFQQRFMSYSFVHSFRAATGWKKRHHHVFLHAYKSGTPKYRVRVKLKLSYRHINWCSCLLFFDVCNIGQNTKIINWKSWNFVCFLCFTRSTTCERNTILKYCRAVFHCCNTNVSLCILCSSVYLRVCHSPKSKLWSWRKSFCFITKIIETRFS